MHLLPDPRGVGRGGGRGERRVSHPLVGGRSKDEGRRTKDEPEGKDEGRRTKDESGSSKDAGWFQHGLVLGRAGASRSTKYEGRTRSKYEVRRTKDEPEVSKKYEGRRTNPNPKGSSFVLRTSSFPSGSGLVRPSSFVLRTSYFVFQEVP